MTEDDDMTKPDLMKEFDRDTDLFRERLGSSHDDLGLVLKCHLIVEEALTRYLKNAKGLKNIGKARLSFAQKLHLIDDSDGTLYSRKSGAKQLNSIRNKFGHNLNTNLEDMDLTEIGSKISVHLEAFDLLRERLKDAFGKAPNEDEAEENMVDHFELLFQEYLHGKTVREDTYSIALVAEGDPRETLKFFASDFHDNVTFMTYDKTKSSDA